jgi:hypothetical protein
MARYPGFYEPLRKWFEMFQDTRPEAHISCAGRGQFDQEMLFIRGASKARYGESAHNYNAAIDFFELQGDIKNIYEPEWFKLVLAPAIQSLSWLRWYGIPGAEFPELPHVEVRDWRVMRTKGALSLVEPMQESTLT